MIINHTKNLTDQVNEILKEADFYAIIFAVFSIILIVLSVYINSGSLFLTGIGWIAVSFSVKLIAYIRCIILGQISQLAYMESRDKE